MEGSNAFVHLDLNCHKVELSVSVWYRYDRYQYTINQYKIVNPKHVDVNECLRNPCGQLCTNTRGSFECDCISGFELQPDGKTCQGKKNYVEISNYHEVNIVA